MIHNISRFIAALALLATAQTAWADTETVSYIDADGNAQTVTATVLTGNEEPNKWGSIELAAGWYVVKGDISYTNQITYVSYPIGTIHIILADGAQMSVDNNGDDAILLYDYHPLAIYGQSAGTGRLSVTSERFAITATGGITINGGIVSATSTGDGWHAIYANNGAITINGGQVTATPGDNAKGISTKGTITLGLRSASDFITANGYYGTVNIKDGQALKDPSGNIYYGTLTDAQKSAIANVTLQPATQAEFIAAALPQTAADTYTISDAAGWDAFCLALQDNDTWNRFSGKTVQLGADISVTRMAGSTGHEFAGTFDGGGYTLTVSITGTVQGTAPFCEIKGATIRKLVVTGSVAGKRHSAGLVGFARGDDASVENTIENCLVATDVSIMGDDNGYLGGIVGHGLKCKLTIRGCAFTGSLTSGSYYTGGLQGWSDGNTLILENDIFAASRVNAANAGFHPIAIHNNNATTTATVSNVYYTVEPTCTTSTRIAAAGKQAHTVAAGENVTIKAVALTGTATQYTVSGITAYSGGGLQRGQTLYYGSDDQLSLTLSNTATGAPQGYQYGYTASAGTLSGTTLTMPDQDVTISVNTATLAPIDWATVNQGHSEDPYMIYNKDQLLLLAHRVNGTNGETANDYSRKYFKLGADITFTYDAEEGDEYDENYEAIGGNIGGTMRLFNGRFNGDGHTVSGIRIRKTSSDDADNCQGLFGCIASGANIRDVHLTDARITGCQNVGGIIGYNTGTGHVSGCTVTDSYITATDNMYYGTICGRSDYNPRLTNNYYHGCTVNDTENATNVGCGGSEIADLAANNGALPAYRLDLGANITTPPGTFAGQTEWLDTPPDGARLKAENGFTLAGNHYFASGYVFTPGSTLASGAAQGYTPRATLGGQLLDLYTPTGDTDPLAGKAIARLTITADCDGKTLASTEAIYSTGQSVTVAYIKADGTPGEASAIALDGHETVGEDGYVHLAAGTYYVGTDIAYANRIYLNGAVTLILADGKTMTLNDNTMGIYNFSCKLTIYGQSLDAATAGTLRYDGTSCGIYVNNYEQHSGNVSITTTGIQVAQGIYAKVTLRGGTLTISASGTNARAINGKTHSILGGQLDVTATGTDATGIFASAESGAAITLGWTRPADFITASSISAPFGGTVAVKDGQALTDGSGNIYTGTLNASVLSGFAAETTLQPCLVLNETNGVTPLAALAGQADVPVIFTRTFSANVASTICLPFAISADQATAAGKFYTFAGVETSGSDWVVTMQEAAPSNLVSGELAANTPYLFMPSSSSEVTFSGTIANVADTYVAGTTNSGDWTYQGTYETLEWKSDPVYIYGFASGQAYGDSGDQTEAGKFIRVHTGGIRPFRAYLEYAPSASGARALSRSANDGLPETMTVRLIGSNGQTTAIGTLDTRTGDVTFGDEWYTLDGRRLPAKPTAKGLYINKGNKVFIK